MKSSKPGISRVFGNIGSEIKHAFSNIKFSGRRRKSASRKSSSFSFSSLFGKRNHRSRRSHGGYGSGSYGAQSGIESVISFIQEHYLYFAIGAAVAIAIPIICFASSGNAQVVIISSIDADASAVSSQYVADDTSGLFEGIIDDSEISTASEEETGTDSDNPSSVLSNITTFIRYDIGMTADFIVNIQERLMDLDYMERDEPTTYYGPATSQAIGYFQRKNGLEQDGVAGEETQRLLFSDNAKVYTVAEGDEGPDVETIQERLEDLGYNVTATGYFGSQTTKAIAYFQRMSGLTDDGCVGTLTREALFASDAETSIELKDQIAAEKAAKEKAEREKAAKSKGKTSKKSSSKSSGKKSGGKVSTTVIANPGNVEAFISVAESMAGVSYVKGGKSGSGVDCSGLVYVALKNSGNKIGYMTSGGWANSGYPTVYSMSELQRGDVVCFKGHVGIYLGGGDMIDASSSQGCVRYCSNIQSSKYWTKNFICGKRPL